MHAAQFPICQLDRLCGARAPRLVIHAPLSVDTAMNATGRPSAFRLAAMLRTTSCLLPEHDRRVFAVSLCLWRRRNASMTKAKAVCLRAIGGTSLRTGIPRNCAKTSFCKARANISDTHNTQSAGARSMNLSAGPRTVGDAPGGDQLAKAPRTKCTAIPSPPRLAS